VNLQFCYAAPMKIKAYMAATALGLWLLVNPAFPEESAPERVIHLKGTSNTRDLGGYQTSDGRTLRWRQIIRSENLSRLTADDFKQLEEMGLKTVIDLRNNREHDQDPTVWQGDHPPQIFHFPIGDSKNDWFTAQRALMKRNRFTEAQALAHMENAYRMIAEEGESGFRQMMALVLDESNWPILIHCTAGKDRAGVAAMLILEAVGVNRETIMEDFMLTNEVSRVEEKSKAVAKARQTYSGAPGGRTGSGQGPTPEAWFTILGVKPEMLEAYYARVDEQYGSMSDFMTEIGVDQEARRALLATLTADSALVAVE
jgi:protein-tyrosine phosphatase